MEIVSIYYDNPRQHIKKQRHDLLTMLCLVKAMVFPVVMCGGESWSIKKAEHRRINVFELWYWRRLLRVFTHIYSKEMKPVHPKENQPWILLEGLMLKLKLQYFGHLMQRADSLEKTRMLGRLKAEGEGDYRGWDGWMASPTWWTWTCAKSGRWWGSERAGVLQSMALWRVGPDLETEQQQQLKTCSKPNFFFIFHL